MKKTSSCVDKNSDKKRVEEKDLESLYIISDTSLNVVCALCLFKTWHVNTNITCPHYCIVFLWQTIQTGPSFQDSTWHSLCSREVAFWMGAHLIFLAWVCLVFWWLAVNWNVLKWEARHSRECVSNNQVAQCNFGVKHDHDLRLCCPPTQTRSMTHGGRYTALFPWL